MNINAVIKVGDANMLVTLMRINLASTRFAILYIDKINAYKI